MNIIVVDDEERIRLGLCKLIEQAGDNYVIIGSYGSGQELLNELEHLEPDLIITDIKMPKMTGLQLISKVIRTRKQVKFAVLSGFNDFEFAREAMRYEVKEYLLKPVNLEELNRMLAKVEASVKQEKSRKRLESEDLVSLLLFADDRQMPATLKDEVSSELDRSRLFAEHYAVLLIGAEPAITDEQLEKFTADWQRERKIVINDSQRKAMVIAVGENDHANTVRELAVTLLQRMPSFTKAKIGISGVFCGSIWLQQAYREASTAFQHAWYNTELRWCSGMNNQSTHKEERYRLLRIIDKEVLPALQICDFAMANRAFESWLTACASHRLNWEVLREVCSDMDVLISEEIKQWLGQQPSIGEAIKMIAPESFEDWRTFADQLREDMNKRFFTLEQGRSENKAIETIKAYLQKHYTEEIELQRLADIVFLTPSYLSKLFKTETGETITDYLTSERIEQAKRLLRDEQGLKTYMVGERVGYADPAYFTKVFKKMTGKTPKEYRDIVR
jgi:two-component system response regulator YesN